MLHPSDRVLRRRGERHAFGPLLMLKCFLAMVLVLSWERRVVDGALVAQSSLQQCSNDGVEPLKCSKKLVVALSVDAELQAGAEVVSFLSSASDDSSSTVVSFEPIQLTISRSAVQMRYPLVYVADFNAKPFEENKKGSLTAQCDDSPTSKASCGVQYTPSGEPIPYSQGYCCSCGTCSALGLCSANARMSVACNLFGSYSVASCLRFGDEWYSGFSIGPASTWFTMDLEFTRNRTSADAGANKDSSTLTLSPSQLDAADKDFGAYAQILGSFHPSVEPQYLSDKMLFVPGLESPLGSLGASEYMLLSNTLVTLDGTECNKVGVSYFAFASQGSRCALEPGSCLGNQLSDLRKVDMANAAAGSPLSYMGTRFGDLSMAEEKLGQSNSGGTATHLSFPSEAPPSTMITVTINADSLQYVVSVASGEITRAEMNQATVEASSKGAAMLVDVKNTGAIVATFTVSVTNCSADVFPIPSRRVSMKPEESVHLELEVSNEDSTEHEASCDVVLLDATKEETARKTVRWLVKPIEQSHGAQGGTTGVNGGEHHDGEDIVGSCGTCSVVNVVCAVKYRCFARSFGFVVVVVGVVGAAVGLFVLRSRLGCVARLLCCCCSASSGGSEHRRGSATPPRSCEPVVEQEKKEKPVRSTEPMDDEQGYWRRRRVLDAPPEPELDEWYPPMPQRSSCSSQLAHSLSLRDSAPPVTRLSGRDGVESLPVSTRHLV